MRGRVLIEHEREGVASLERRPQGTPVGTRLNERRDAAVAARGPERLQRPNAEPAGDDVHPATPEARVGQALELPEMGRHEDDPLPLRDFCLNGLESMNTPSRRRTEHLDDAGSESQIHLAHHPLCFLARERQSRRHLRPRDGASHRDEAVPHPPQRPTHAAAGWGR